MRTSRLRNATPGGGALAIAGALALVLALALVAPAQAAKLGGKTTLQPDPETFAALDEAGIQVAPRGDAAAGDDGISFPITNGKLDREYRGVIRHSGGLRFFNEEGDALIVKNFRIVISDERAVLRAVVPGAGVVRLADLDLSKAEIDKNGKRVTISGVEVALAKPAAEAFSATFGVPDLTGAHLGVATVAARL
ncbi:hypothetical protein HJD18_08405 [Thermoleophilia bacterium SCSIO 60948]|nr:hypothetical protein HJD18_08405 [Thermoleophilia bacterium SCSIO 60948]